MRILSKSRRQRCTYWPPAGLDARGRQLYGTPVELRVRWEDTNEQTVNPKGETFVSRSKVYTGEDVELGGVLLLSTLANAIKTGSPFRNVGAFEIRRFDKLPTLKGTKFLRTAWL